MSSEIYSYSLDGQTFHGRFVTRDEAIAAGITAALEGRQLSPGAELQTGRHDVRPHAREFLPDIDTVLEYMAQKASDDYGAEDWPDIGEDDLIEEQAVLSAALQAIAEAVQRVSPPTFHHIVDWQNHVVPEA